MSGNILNLEYAKAFNLVPLFSPVIFIQFVVSLKNYQSASPPELSNKYSVSSSLTLESTAV